MHKSNKYNPRVQSKGKWYKRRWGKYDDHDNHNRICFDLSLEKYYRFDCYPGGIIPRDPVTHEYIVRNDKRIWTRAKQEWVICDTRMPDGEHEFGAKPKPNGAWKGGCRTRTAKNFGNREIRRVEKRELQKIMQGMQEDFEAHCRSNVNWYW